MGDNIFLGDRDGVRTPMQWTSDRNGGFSRVDPQRLYLPPIQDPIYGYEAVNVEAQSREPSSLLNWTRRLLTVRSSSRAFGRGRFTMLHPGNRKILAYLRETEDDVVLCVANVSRIAQPVELELSAYRGRVPVEMMGRNAFPPIGDLPYLMTLPAHGFFWFRLATDAEPPRWHSERLPVEDLQTVVLFDGWNSFFRTRVVPWRIGMAERTRTHLERELLPQFLSRQRWYAGKSEALERAALADSAMLADEREQWLLALVDAQGPLTMARYFVPLAIAFEERDEERVRQLGAVALAKVRQQANVGVLADAMADEPFCAALVRAIGAGRTLKTDGGTLQFKPGRAFKAVAEESTASVTPLRRLTTSSNSVSLLGDRLFLKAFRRLQPGESPELEMGRFLTDVVGFAHCVPVAGAVSFVDAAGQVTTLALLQAQITNQGDVWAFVVDQVARMLETAGAGAEIDHGSGVIERMKVLARRVAELHVALATRSGDAAFDPEPITRDDLVPWTSAVMREIDETLGKLARQGGDASAPLAALAADVMRAAPALRERVARVLDARPAGLKTRLHGDLHLGQVLLCRDDFMIVDFEGEPQRPLPERRAKHSALRDVAGMLRSFDYARHAALNQVAKTPPEVDRLAPISGDWGQRVRDAFLGTYREVALAGGLYADGAAFEAALDLLTMFEIEKALYELRYEMDNRPEWIAVPLAGIAALAAAAA
jgi:maltose alpha-D-glucosyltransferase/alpha-amylase